VTTGSFDISGGLVGGTAGFNMQTGQIVWGLEGDIAWADIGGSSAAAACGTRCETHIGWLGTVRGRLGYAIDRFLPYVTGGLAVGEVRTRIPGVGLADGNTTKAGWTIGGGAEFALTTNISAKAEYLYVDLGRVDCGAPCAPGGTPVHVKSNAHVVRAGLNFRF
jgi:outer membrane immunogenic protein